MPAPQYHKYIGKVLRAAIRADADASEAQHDAGNARVGRVYCHGLELAISHPKGATRTGTARDGRAWSTPMRAHYGRINRLKNNETLRFFLGPHPESQLVFVVEQLTAGGDHDKRVAVLGCLNVAEAKKLYLDHYPEGWHDTRVGEIRGATMQQFKEWLGVGVKKEAADRPPRDDAKESADCEDCPCCGASMERGDDGYCNRCGKPWPAVTR